MITMHGKVRTVIVVGCLGLVGCGPAVTEPVAPPGPSAQASAPSSDAPSTDAPEAAVSEPSPAPTPRAEPEQARSSGSGEYEPLSLSEEGLARARRVQGIVRAAAKAHGVDPHLLNGIIWHESKFNPRAKGPSGARGLMQLMPKTSAHLAKRLNRRHRPYDPDFNIHAGALLISTLLHKYDGDESLALAAYARGSGWVRGWQKRGGPLPERVQKFIRKVKRGQAAFAQAFGTQARAGASAAAAF